MSFVMTAGEREAFLAEVHIGVLAVSREGRAPLAVPVWYDYQPGGEMLILTKRDAVKYKLIRAAGRFSLAVQSENWPYRYVTAEGSVVANDVLPTTEQSLAIVSRYLPADDAAALMNGALGQDLVLVRMRPEKWLSNDQSKPQD